MNLNEARPGNVIRLVTRVNVRIASCKVASSLDQ